MITTEGASNGVGELVGGLLGGTGGATALAMLLSWLKARNETRAAEANVRMSEADADAKTIQTAIALVGTLEAQYKSIAGRLERAETKIDDLRGENSALRSALQTAQAELSQLRLRQAVAL